MKKNLIALERDIPYDWDDYGVWCSFYYDPNEKKIIRSDYVHGTDDAYSGVSYEIAIANGMVTRDVVTKYMGREISGEYTNVDNEKKAQKLKEKNEKLYAENIDRVRAWAREKFAGRPESEIEEIIDKTMKKYYTKK